MTLMRLKRFYMAKTKVSESKTKQSDSEMGASHLASRNAMAKQRLARIKGQITGVERMFEEGRYCPDIIQQIRSVRQALKGLEIAVLEKHMASCVRNAIEAKSSAETEKKLNEILELMKSN
jgi:DNA-binding FrmR family transcriptional regulator